MTSAAVSIPSAVTNVPRIEITTMSDTEILEQEGDNTTQHKIGKLKDSSKEAINDEPINIIKETSTDNLNASLSDDSNENMDNNDDDFEVINEEDVQGHVFSSKVEKELIELLEKCLLDETGGWPK
jgi:hypothetical protein